MLFTGRVKWPKWRLHIYVESYSSLCRAWMILYGFEYGNCTTSISTWEFKWRKGLGLLKNSNLLKLVLWTGATCTSPSWKEMLLRIICHERSRFLIQGWVLYAGLEAEDTVWLIICEVANIGPQSNLANLAAKLWPRDVSTWGHGICLIEKFNDQIQVHIHGRN